MVDNQIESKQHLSASTNHGTSTKNPGPPANVSSKSIIQDKIMIKEPSAWGKTSTKATQGQGKNFKINHQPRAVAKNVVIATVDKATTNMVPIVNRKINSMDESSAAIRKRIICDRLITSKKEVKTVAIDDPPIIVRKRVSTYDPPMVVRKPALNCDPPVVIRKRLSTYEPLVTMKTLSKNDRSNNKTIMKRGTTLAMTKKTAKSPTVFHKNRLTIIQKSFNQENSPVVSMKNQDEPSGVSQNEYKVIEAQKLTKMQKAIKDFAEKVSIGGIRETYQAESRAEKAMWYLTLITASCGMIISSYNLVEAFTNQRTTFNDMAMVNGEAPFPNITFCVPEAVDKQKGRPTVVVTKKTKDFIKRNLMHQEAVVDIFLEYMTINLVKPRYNDTMTYALKLIGDATFRKYPGGFLEYSKSLFPSCDEILSNCYFDNKPFNCCQVSRLITFNNAICYQLQVSI